MGKLKLKDLYFGCKNFDSNTHSFEIQNIFGSMRVLHSIATYKVHGYTPLKENLTKEEYKESLLSFLFGDLKHHVEWEMLISSVLTRDGVVKTDIYSMYVMPNQDYLLGLVEKVSVSSCKKWLRDYNERRYGKRRI